MSAHSGAATELLGQALHAELQHDLLALQLEKSPLQLLDQVLQLLQLVAMPIRTSPHGIDTGGKGCFTQWGNGEFIVITEAIHPHFTQWVNYDYLSNVPTNLPRF